ncbi:cyclic di-GMP phosphodiesterase response regulator RpfG [Clostridium homopropionicum DSM 5847]|uniref:Cyclic di-GMP phosphodiesterase response regulator RpfG n=1 Tax=Clostridium homopropionicum DSM 5847 TaxID=1121318 RepID=A0A0L6Z9T4_9CLOT|nr:HD domain-containing phosphohydrolase [Clostridium homopropionicum]KOA19726.1 cyclic di-GMP phosphodiesterase response regulator RpfG [Clostridium homopropionicum DSM 5847]SFF78948.1 HDIG domain-containing protein [Clostridium homopropionicum]
MNEVNLKKLVGKSDVKEIVYNILREINIEISVLDLQGNIILGTSKKDEDIEFPININEKVAGFVMGESKAAIIAKLLSYIGNSEFNKKMLIKETLNKYREINLLYNLSEKMASTIEAKEISKIALEEATRLINSTKAEIAVFSKDRKRLEKVVELNKHNSTINEVGLNNYVNTVLDEGVGQIINYLDDGSESMVCTPLKVKDKTLGVISISNSNNIIYDSEDLKLLNAIATQAAIALDNTNLYDSIRDTFLQTIEALIETIEKKDSYTAGHARRVAVYSISIGEELGLNRSEITQVRLAALLHDIGKIGIQDKILLKNSRLTGEEYEVIKKHPVFGAEILENIDQLKDVVPSVRGHHERYDGKGYPDGKKGTEIPLIARIIAVADAFDAMTSHRPYISNKEKEQALNEIYKNINTQFDPVVVEAFLKRVKV